MNASELLKLSPYGATVRFTDGTPRPPDRFKKKLREWERSNAAGFYKGPVSDGFGLQTGTSDFLTMTRSFTVGFCTLDFTVEPRLPGTLIAWRKWSTDGRIEVAHVWTDGVAAGESWAKRNKYDLTKCGYSYWLVDEAGRLQDWSPVAVTV